MDLKIEEKIRLLTGRGMWHTQKVGDLDEIHLSDGPHGLRKQDDDASSNNDSYKATCFPTASAVACSFSRDLAFKMGQSIALEAWNNDVSILLGPGVNMKRSPLCGRNFEYYSEDPFLAGSLGLSFINGVESEGIGTSLKHFAGNSQETCRQSSNSQIDERTLREIYLKAFEMIIKNSNPASVMASYNLLNGEYATENKHLLKDILRDEWGYKGVVVSDWGAAVNITNAIKNGTDLDMPDSNGLHIKRITKDFKKGLISEEEIVRANQNVINMVNKYSIKNRVNNDKKDDSKNHEIARIIEENSAVLLRNDGVLPLKENKITIIGALAKNVRYQGGGSSHINTVTKNALEVFEENNYEVTYEQGYLDTKDEFNEELFNKAIELSKNSETILFFGGLPDFAEGEGYDRKTYEMPSNQKVLLDEILKLDKRVIFISFSGAPYNMYFSNDVNALLHMYLGGEAVMEAMFNLVTGKVSPSGRLAETFPMNIEDNPTYGNYANTRDIKYKEGLFIGYRFYDTYRVRPRFYFGYGLSYSKFKYDDLHIEKENENYRVTFKVRNIGTMPSRISSLLYIENPKSNFIRESNALKGFTDCYLEVDEQKECEIILSEDAFKIYSKEESRWIKVKGTYNISIGGPLNNIYLSDLIDVDGEEYDFNELELYPEFFDYDNKLKNISDETFNKMYDKELSHLDDIKKGQYTIATSLQTLSKHSLLAKIIYKVGVKEILKMCGTNNLNDPEVLMSLQTLNEGTLDAVAMHSGGLISVRLEDAMVLGANGHKLKALWKLIIG